MINRTEIMKAAHRQAKMIVNDEGLKYSKALSKGLKILYHNYRMIKAAKTNLTTSEKQLIIKSKGNLEITTIENHKLINMDLVEKLKKYSYRNWKYFGGYNLKFSPELIKAL